MPFLSPNQQCQSTEGTVVLTRCFKLLSFFYNNQYWWTHTQECPHTADCWCSKVQGMQVFSYFGKLVAWMSTRSPPTAELMFDMLGGISISISLRSGPFRSRSQSDARWLGIVQSLCTMWCTCAVALLDVVLLGTCAQHGFMWSLCMMRDGVASGGFSARWCHAVPLYQTVQAACPHRGVEQLRTHLLKNWQFK